MVLLARLNFFLVLWFGSMPWQELWRISLPQFHSAGRSQETLESNTKDFTIQGLSHSMTFIWNPIGPVQKWTQVDAVPKSRFCTRAEKAKLKEHNFLQNYYKQTCPIFAWQGDNIFIILNSKQIYYLPQRETMSLSSKDVHYTNIYEKIVPSKSPRCIQLEIWYAGAWKTHGELSPRILLDLPAFRSDLPNLPCSAAFFLSLSVCRDKTVFLHCLLSDLKFRIHILK